MKKSVTIIILILIVVTFGFSMVYLYQKNAEDPIVYETEQPSTQNIVKKAVATGSILPLEEVLIKPNISGVIEDEGGNSAVREYDYGSKCAFALPTGVLKD